MKHRSAVLRLILVIVLCLIASTVGAQTWTKSLGNGLTLTQKVIAPSEVEEDAEAAPVIPEIINILKIDPKASGVRVQAVLAQDRVLGKDPTKGREVVSSIARRLNAAAVVNADFFPFTGDALNLHISSGELMSEPNPQRVVFGMTSDGRFLFDRLEFDARLTLPSGKWFPIRGINRQREHHQLVAYTSRFGDTTCTTNGGSEAVIECDSLPVRIGVPIKAKVIEAKCQSGDTTISPNALILSGSGTGQKFVDEQLKPGTEFTMEFNLKPSKTKGWEKVTEAVGGGPWLVKDGKVNVDALDEGFQPGFFLTRHPRTAVGVTRDGKLVVVTVDGRQSISGGMSLPELAALMLSEGCVEAVNLDGGGSSTMATSLGILNSPSGGIERAIANALAIFAEIPGEDVPEFTISPQSEPVASGQSVQLSLVDTEGKPLDPVLAERAVWTSTGGAGFVDQSGRFHGIKIRKGAIIARIGRRVAGIQVETVAGALDTLSAKLQADVTGAPNRSALVVSLKDLNGNPVPDKEVSLRVEGGLTDSQSLKTDADGKASTGITWDGDGTPGQVEVTCNGHSTVVERPLGNE